MPIVLTQNEITESGHDYGDVLGVSYEYPRRYRDLIRTGERFVYYRGRRTKHGPNRPQVYLGSGVIGTISPSGTSGLLVCLIENYRPFTSPVPFKAWNGYLESAANAYGSKAGLDFRSGVRWISERA
jgi:putative restriction endonuclease